jgi:predicted DNA-binding helix-hairpin-helix protein
VELPTQVDLENLAPEKNLGRIRGAMNVIRERITEAKTERRQSKKAPAFAPAGQSTQMIVGATPSSDRLILQQTASLYQEHKLRRVYFSAFSPIPDASSDLPLQSPPLVREHRLYQADWLLRFYGFSEPELTTEAAPNLPLNMDPKLAWALRHPEQFPIDVQTATREQLLRVPGLGVRNVDRILQARRWHKITLADLIRLRVPSKKILPFIITQDHRPATIGGSTWRNLAKPVKQLELFAPEPSVFSGQL